MDSLIDTDKKAGCRLLDATLYAAPLLHGLVALTERFDALARLPGLDEDIAGLFRQSADTVYEGVKACIYAPGPRIMDQSRFLMEVEFLLYDLTARPESVDEWKTAEPFRRNQLFGFGKLRSRREADLGYPRGQVLPVRDEYSSHSALVHPRPARELTVPDETPSARRFYLTADLADLFGHAVQVSNAADDALEGFLAEDRFSERDASSFPDPEIVTRAHDFIADWHAKLGIRTPPHPG